jgi:hypothetical protein
MKKTTLFLLACLAILVTPSMGHACAVCYGDPNSLQVQGAEAGVLFLLGVIITVLLSIAGMILFWVVRARRIAQVTDTVSLPAYH